MNQPVILKVYGNLWPARASLFQKLREIAASACPQPDSPALNLDGDLLVIAFEGCFFPVEETLAAIRFTLTKEQQGKLDVLDLEAWRLARHVFANGQITTSSASLNNVLAFSGH